jgi:hypothetical protein
MGWRFRNEFRKYRLAYIMRRVDWRSLDPRLYAGYSKPSIFWRVVLWLYLRGLCHPLGRTSR